MILVHGKILNNLEHLSYVWCVSAEKTSPELGFYNIFGHLMRFCYSVNYFENMNAFADKLQFTDQILLAKITKLVIFLFLTY